MTSCEQCRACFPSGSPPQAVSFASSLGALRHFNLLSVQGYSPTMCEDGERGVRVCVQLKRAPPECAAQLPASRYSGRIPV